jgi:hypothetical protein
MNIEVPIKLLPLYSTQKRFIDIYGGRGGAKSHGVADFLLCQSRAKKARILCCREIQRSIKDSVWQLLTEKIDAYKWDSEFYVTEQGIICKRTGSDFIFKGLRGNAQDIKSTEGVQYAWVEEAQSVSRKSLEILVPTIRNPNSQIIFTYNPTLEEDPVHQDYTLADREDTLKININWRDNPWFPQVLRNDLEYDKKTNYNKYLHVWEGHTEILLKEQIGLFPIADTWGCDYCVAFIDPSFSDKADTDSTAVAVVGVRRTGEIVWTGCKWPKSISDRQTRREIIVFLNQYTPVVSVIESQLSDTSIFFIDAMRETESELNVKIKNYWEIHHQPSNRSKHERIMAAITSQRERMRMLEGTQNEYKLEVVRYSKMAEHDDCPDALAGAVETLGTSEVVAEYVKAIQVLNQRK